MLHEVMEKCLIQGHPEVPYSIINYYGLDRAQTEACDDCLEYIALLKMRINDPNALEQIEARGTLAPLASTLGCPELADVWGTLDYSLTTGTTLAIIDWKFGSGVEVFPDSAQLKAYALAALAAHANPRDLEVLIVVGQPRLPSGERFKSLVTSYDDLISWAKEDLVPALSSANSANPLVCPGEKQCRWCRCKNTCSARFEKAQEVASNVFAQYAKLPDQINPEELSELLGQAKVLTDYLKDLHEYATGMIKQGKPFPGYKLVAGRSRRTWAEVDELGFPKGLAKVVEPLGFDLVSDFSVLKPLSPAQAEKVLMPKARRSKEFTSLVYKPEGKPTLVPESDKREPLDYETPESKFAQFKVTK
jgi:hypothetical protein